MASTALAWMACAAACQITAPAQEEPSAPRAAVEHDPRSALQPSEAVGLDARASAPGTIEARASAPGTIEPTRSDASSDSRATVSALQSGAPPPAGDARPAVDAPPAGNAVPSGVPVAERWVERSLPVGWDTVSTRAFERALDAWVAPPERVRLPPADLATLASTLDRDDPAAMRAALLLARSRDPSAGEALMQHLEKRIAAGEYDERLDAPDVVAAAAFARGVEVENRETRLVTLALGKRPHPDFEVRVECAASALALGRDQVIPFLVHVLRERTSARVTKPDWTRKNDVDWAQWRASRALAARAGTTALFDPSASMHARLSEAERLEELCRPFVPKAP